MFFTSLCLRRKEMAGIGGMQGPGAQRGKVVSWRGGTRTGPDRSAQSSWWQALGLPWGSLRTQHRNPEHCFRRRCHRNSKMRGCCCQSEWVAGCHCWDTGTVPDTFSATSPTARRKLEFTGVVTCPASHSDSDIPAGVRILFCLM